MNKYIFSLILLFAASAVTKAQTGTADAGDGVSSKVKETDNNLLRAALKGWHVSLGAGFNIGGTSPLPLPREIRKIDGYKPGLQIALEGRAHKRFQQSPWGISVGVRLENKGMETDATVKNYHMEAVNADGSGTVKGAWTGKVKTNTDLSYVSVPILATYSLGERWKLEAGPYFSVRTSGSFTGEAYDGYIRDQNPTGEYAEVSLATYDFSKNLRDFAWGIQLGGEFMAYRHLAVRAFLQWGMNGIFPSDFESVTFSLYPIYGTFGFAYVF